MEERYIVSADLGSSKIALAVAKITGEDIQVIHYSETPSDGIRYSYVLNPQKALTPLLKALKDAEDALGIKITQVVTGLPGFYVQQENVTGELERTDSNSIITEEEIRNLKDMSLDNYVLEESEDKMIYGAVAQSFSTDDFYQAMESDVVGMMSRKLEGNFKIFIGNKRNVGNMEKIFNDSGVAIAKKYFIPEVLSGVILTEEEMSSGVALIDLGAGISAVSIFHNGILRHYASIPFGGSTITGDIRTEGGFTAQLAENIKKAYGACMPDKLASMSEKVIKVAFPESDTEKQLPVRYLSEVITARENEILTAVLYEIEKSGYADDLRSGVVITGGGAELTNVANYLKDLSGYNVRIGYPRHKFSASGFPGAFEASAAGCMGMIVKAKDDKIINCASEGGSSAFRNAPASPVVGQEQAVEENPDTLFPEDNEFEDVKEIIKTEEKKRKKDRSLSTKKEDKPKEKDNGEKSGGLWGLFKEFYEDMNKEENV